MKTKKLPLATIAALSLSISSFNASAETAAHLITQTPYKNLYETLNPNIKQIKKLVDEVKDQSSYGKLVSFARDLTRKVPNGRVTITLPDGTAVFDGGQQDDSGDSLPKGNSYAHYQSKTITENLNTRLSNFDAQEHVDGLGAETRLSSVTKKKEVFVGIRLGAHLNNSGTARLSQKF